MISNQSEMSIYGFQIWIPARSTYSTMKVRLSALVRDPQHEPRELRPEILKPGSKKLNPISSPRNPHPKALRVVTSAVDVLDDEGTLLRLAPHLLQARRFMLWGVGFMV